MTLPNDIGFWQAVVTSAPEAMVVADAQGRIIMANPAAERLLAHAIPYGEPIESQVRMGLCDPEGGACAPDELPLNRSALQGEVIVDREMTVYQSRRQVGHLLVSTAPVRDANGECHGAVGIFKPFTIAGATCRQIAQGRLGPDNRGAAPGSDLAALTAALTAGNGAPKPFETDLHRSQEALRRLSRRTLETLEADRQLVAKELHDSIGASLAAIKFSLEEKLARMAQGTAAQGLGLEKILEYLQETIKETKRIAARLRPATLDDLGLQATLSWYVREFKNLYNAIAVDLEVVVAEAEIPDPHKIVIYRIIQEAMHNAAKHGRSSAIQIRLAREGHDLVLTVSDDGQGFDPQMALATSADPISGFGLQGMRERAEISGGRFAITSRIGAGTRVDVVLPLSD